jgi:membrane-associated phospholipid phosphatase
MRVSPVLRRLAVVFSRLGHPLITAPAFVACLAWQRLPATIASWVAGSVVLVVLLISLWNLRQTRRGTYTNFDVSERGQRNSFYPMLLGLLGLATAGLFWQSAGPFRYGLLAAWLMLLVCYGLNFWLKVSLHAAMSFFLAYAVLQLYPGWGWLALVLAVLVTASRLVLGRHALSELLVGAGLGLTASGGLAWYLTHA